MEKSEIEKICNVYFSAGVMKIVQNNEVVSKLVKMRSTYKILVGKCKGKRPLGDISVYGWVILK
jgi:hypothetical protein